MSFNQFQIIPTAHDADAINAAMKKLLGDATLEEIGFTSQAEFQKALANPKYEAPGAEGEAYRRLVGRMVQNSQHEWSDVSHNEQAAVQRRAGWKAEEDRAILREYIQEQMNDPRYESSTLFRKQIREMIDKNPHLFEQGMGPQPTRVKARVQLDGGLEEAQAAIAKERDEKREKAKKDAIAEAERRVALPYIDVATGEEHE